MTSGLLLDTHAIIWLESGSKVAPGTLIRVASAAIMQGLFLSHASIWELGVSLTKIRIDKRPDLKGYAPAVWFNRFAQRFDALQLPLSAEIMAESALVPAVVGYGDPGDCFLIATARMHNLALVTRDSRMIALSAANPGYLSVIPC
jgi:PIN domain nuclease of toxin-antitoxin system